MTISNINCSQDLFVREISQQYFMLYSRIAGEWAKRAEEIARNYLNQCDGISPGNYRMDVQRFHDCMVIADNVRAQLGIMAKSDEISLRFFVCYHETNVLGMMILGVEDVFRPNCADIDWLVCHPDQIYVTHRPKRIRGVGRTLVQNAETIARLAGKRWLGLRSSCSAIKFYQKLGFESLDKEDGFLKALDEPESRSDEPLSGTDG